MAHYFALSDLVVSIFFIYLYIVLRRRTIYLCGVVQFHNANIHDISIISNFYNRIFDYFLIENYGEGVINYE